MSKNRAVVFGAGEKGVSVKRSLTAADIQVQYFVVSDKSKNPSEQDGLPVVSIEEFLTFRKNGMLNVGMDTSDGKAKEPIVYIAVPDEEQNAIATLLRGNDYNDYVKIEPDSFGKMMNRYYNGLHIFPSVKDIPSEELLSEKVFIAQTYSENDDSAEAKFHPNPWVRKIQCGAAVAKEKYGVDTGDFLYDNKGENISFLNKTYGMLTALYWLWKNTDAEYLGLFQRRRILDVKKLELVELLKDEYDIILPYPKICVPKAETHVEELMVLKDWEAVKQAFAEERPEWTDEINHILSNQYLYNHNIFVGKRKVVTDYCEWLFPPLKKAAGYVVSKSGDSLYRYFEYAAELLSTVYFMSKKHELRCAHTTELTRV